MHAHVAAVLRCVIPVLYLHFFNGVNTRHNVGNRDEVVHDGDAIQRQAIGDLTLSCSDEIFAGRDSGLARFGADNDIRRGGRQL